MQALTQASMADALSSLPNTQGLNSVNLANAMTQHQYLAPTLSNQLLAAQLRNAYYPTQMKVNMMQAMGKLLPVFANNTFAAQYKNLQGTPGFQAAVANNKALASQQAGLFNQYANTGATPAVTAGLQGMNNVMGGMFGNIWGGGQGAPGAGGQNAPGQMPNSPQGFNAPQQGAPPQTLPMSTGDIQKLHSLYQSQGMNIPPPPPPSSAGSPSSSDIATQQNLAAQRANQSVTDKTLTQRYQTAQSLSNFLNTPNVQQSFQTLAKYEGLAGKTLAQATRLGQDKEWADYQSSAKQLSSIISGSLKQLEGMPTSNEGLDTAKSYFTMSQDALFNNTSRAIEYYNKGIDLLNAEEGALTQAASRVVPMKPIPPIQHVTLPGQGHAGGVAQGNAQKTIMINGTAYKGSPAQIQAALQHYPNAKVING